jgi:hypothetical protein
MSEQKKDKPKVDVRDLKPTKDAKGGGKTPESGKSQQGIRPANQ